MASRPVYSTAHQHDVGELDAALRDASPVPFWIDDLPTRTPAPALRDDTSADLLVIGGGFAGLWTALQAKEREPARDVLLIEARALGWAASGRNGGFCEASLTHGNANARMRFDDELAAIREVERDNFTGLLDTLDRYGMQVEFEPTGVLQTAVEEHHVAELRAAATPETPLLTGEALARYSRAPVHRAGLLKLDGYALLHPARLVQELRRVCVELGVRIHEATPALALRRDGDGVRVQVPGGAIRARRVALAANGFRSLLPRLRLLTLPVYDYALMTEPLTPAQLEEIGWTGRHGITDSGRQFHYARKSADDRVLWGGFDAVYHPGGRVRDEHDQRPETFRRLADHFLTTFPALTGVRFTHSWGGMIDMSTRLVASQGIALGGRVAYSLGYTGLGVAATRFGAATMLDLLEGSDTPRTRLRLATGLPIPIPPEPFATPIVQTIRGAVARADERGRPGPLLTTLERFGIGFDS